MFRGYMHYGNVRLSKTEGEKPKVIFTINCLGDLPVLL